MPIIPAWEVRDQNGADARFIGLAAALRSFQDCHKFDVDVMRKHIGEIAQDDMDLIAPAMSVAQWIAGHGLPK